MPELELDCAIKSMCVVTRTLVAHGTPKFHKGKGNLPPFRPVVVVVGSPFNCISRWVDMHLRDSLDQIPSYVKNSNEIVLKINCLNELDENAFLFAVDATAMHPNSNPEEKLMFLKLELYNLTFKVEPSWPSRGIINAIKVLLRFNAF